MLMKTATPPTETELPDAVGQHAAQRWDGQTLVATRETIADEVPVALVYNGISHVVMLMTPEDLEEFAVGFSFTEGIIKSVKDIFSVEIKPSASGIEVAMTISGEQFAGLKERRRNLAGRTGCGICGAESLAHAVRRFPPVATGARISATALHRAFDALHGRQRLHALTGAVHAAAWADPQGKLALVREDVGRHNALDKLIGVLARGGARFDSGFAIFTSRASSEMVQKAAAVGITTIAAVSAPTGLAVRLAEESGLTLIGFVRDHQHTVYANPERIVTESAI